MQASLQAPTAGRHQHRPRALTCRQVADEENSRIRAQRGLNARELAQLPTVTHMPRTNGAAGSAGETKAPAPASAPLRRTASVPVHSPDSPAAPTTHAIAIPRAEPFKPPLSVIPSSAGTGFQGSRATSVFLDSDSCPPGSFASASASSAAFLWPSPHADVSLGVNALRGSGSAAVQVPGVPPGPPEAAPASTLSRTPVYDVAGAGGAVAAAATAVPCSVLSGVLGGAGCGQGQAGGSAYERRGGPGAGSRDAVGGDSPAAGGAEGWGSPRGSSVVEPLLQGPATNGASEGCKHAADVDSKARGQGGGATRYVCCVCLEDYAAGDCLRILPCQHRCALLVLQAYRDAGLCMERLCAMFTWQPSLCRFHRACIDQWLQHHRLCPVCKHDCLISLVRVDDDDFDLDSHVSLWRRLLSAWHSVRSRLQHHVAHGPSPAQFVAQGQHGVPNRRHSVPVG